MPILSLQGVDPFFVEHAIDRGSYTIGLEVSLVINERSHVQSIRFQNPKILLHTLDSSRFSDQPLRAVRCCWLATC